jgi:hypothetical protein
MPATVTASGPVRFGGGTVGHTVVGSAAAGWGEDPSGFYLERGTLTVDYRLAGFDGALEVTGLALRLGFGPGAPVGEGAPIAPLPDAAQPDQDDPVGSADGTGRGVDGVLPAVQLFDRSAGRWVELEPMAASRTYRVADPARYVDASGGLLVRFVHRAPGGAGGFSLGVRLEGSAS